MLILVHLRLIHYSSTLWIEPIDIVEINSLRIDTVNQRSHRYRPDGLLVSYEIFIIIRFNISYDLIIIRQIITLIWVILVHSIKLVQFLIIFRKLLQAVFLFLLDYLQLLVEIDFTDFWRNSLALFRINITIAHINFLINLLQRV